MSAGCTVQLPRYAVLDGGFATEAVRRGNQAIDDDPLWSSRLLSSEPEEVKAIHRGFLDAGADIIETNTYQGSVGGFMKHLDINQSQASLLLEKAVSLATEARKEFLMSKNGSQSCIVAGSMGPYGASLHDGSEYTGGYVDAMSHQELIDAHRDKLNLLLGAGVDLVAMETIPAQKEAEALTALLTEFPSAHAWISFSCKDSEHTCHGEKLLAAAQTALHSPLVAGIGINCTNPTFITPLLQQLHGKTLGKIVIVYPNSGEAWTPECKWHSDVSLRPIVDYLDEWVSLGARWIGGCCRVTPQEVTDINRALQKYKVSAPS